MPGLILILNLKTHHMSTFFLILGLIVFISIVVAAMTNTEVRDMRTGHDISGIAYGAATAILIFLMFMYHITK